MMNLNHLRNLSLVSYTALIPVALLTERFCVRTIAPRVKFVSCFCWVMKSQIQLYLATVFGDLDHVQLHLAKYSLKLRSFQFSDAMNNHIVYDRMQDVLYLAAMRGQLAMMQYALDQGANWNYTHNDGYTALHGAVSWGRVEAAMLLMRYGADLNARSNCGKLPIDMARTEEMRYAIREEPRRRMDHGFKRAT